MIFMSYWFVVFVMSFFLLYFLIPIFAIRKMLLVFYGVLFQVHFAGPAGVTPIVILGVVTYLAGLSNDRRLQISAIALCVLSLVFYKYTLFVIKDIISLFDVELANRSLNTMHGNLIPDQPPLAISFFVFEFVHYLTDLLTKQAKPIAALNEFVIFSLFWPTVVAGPIKRYEQFVPSANAGCSHATSEDIMLGMIRVALGISKKVVADNLTAMTSFWIDNFEEASFGMRWFVFIAVGVRILLDFSGYSDMAIGFSRMMGIRVPENFNWPYLASGPIDFWRRWHISLSTWIRDYIYIPLGGGRVTLARKIANGTCAFAICGLWHGAGWNFMFWGLYHGAGVAINGWWRDTMARRATIRYLAAPLSVLSWFCTLIFVFVGWIFFFYPVSKALRILEMVIGIR